MTTPEMPFELVLINRTELLPVAARVSACGANPRHRRDRGYPRQVFDVVSSTRLFVDLPNGDNVPSAMLV
jgi:hypothetical protein